MKDLPFALTMLALALGHTAIFALVVAGVQWVGQCLTLGNWAVWTIGLSTPGCLLLLLLYIRGAAREREDLARP